MTAYTCSKCGETIKSVHRLACNYVASMPVCPTGDQHAWQEAPPGTKVSAPTGYTSLEQIQDAVAASMRSRA